MYINIRSLSPSPSLTMATYPLPRTYNTLMLLAAYLIGILGTYTATQLMAQVPSTRRLGRKLAWAAAAAFSVGGTAGVGMHWVKMLAAIYPYRASYHLPLPLLFGTLMVLLTFLILSIDILLEARARALEARRFRFSLLVPASVGEEIGLLPASHSEVHEKEAAEATATAVAAESPGLRRRPTPSPEAQSSNSSSQNPNHAVMVHGLYTPDLTPPAEEGPDITPSSTASSTPTPPTPRAGNASCLPIAPRPQHAPALALPPMSASAPPSVSASPRPPSPSRFHAHVHHHHPHLYDPPTSHPHHHSPTPPAHAHHPHPHPHTQGQGQGQDRPGTPGSLSASGSSNQAELFLPPPPSPGPNLAHQRAQISRLPLGRTILGWAFWSVYLSVSRQMLVKACVLTIFCWLMHMSALLSLHFPELDAAGIRYGYRWDPRMLLASMSTELLAALGVCAWVDNTEPNPLGQVWFAVFLPTAASTVHFLCVWSGTLWISTPPAPLPPSPSADIPSLILTLAVTTYVLSYATLAEQITLSRNRLAETIFTKRRLWRVIAEKEACARANMQKSEFIAVASHEIRTPLHAILGFTDLLLQTPLTEEQSTCLEAIRMGCNSIQLITNNVLDFSKLEHNTRDSAAHATEVNVRTLSLRILRSVSAPQRMTEHQLRRLVNYNLPQDDESPSLHLPDEKHVELLLEVHEAVPELVRLDEVYITRVVMNLISNALKFTDDGFVFVRVTIEHSKHEPAGAKPVLAIMVRDSGIGIPSESKQAIFEPFRQVDGSLTRTHTGAGLGLAISKQLCERMGGTIDVRSKPGVGSEFVVRVPAFEGVGEVPDPLHMPRTPFSFMTVAVAVRSLKTFHLYKELLERRGFLLRPIDLDHPEKELQVSLAKVDRLLVDVESLAVAPWLLDWIIRLPQIPSESAPISVFVLIDDLSTEVGQQLIRMLKGSGQVALVHRPVMVHTLLESLKDGCALSPQSTGIAPILRHITTPLNFPKSGGKSESEYEYFPAVLDSEAAQQPPAPRRNSGTLDWEDTVGRILNPLEPVVQRARVPPSDKRVRFESQAPPPRNGPSPIRLRPPAIPALTISPRALVAVSPSTEPSPIRVVAPLLPLPPVLEQVPKTPPTPKKHILLVEDNVVNQKLGIRLLQKLSHRCDVAENGKVALDMLQANEDKYSLVLMDCQMPVMNGFECTRQIRSLEHTGVRKGRLPIVALTANVSSESREESQQAGADFFLPKPLLLQDLKDTLNQFIAVVA